MWFAVFQFFCPNRVIYAVFFIMTALLMTACSLHEHDDATVNPAHFSTANLVLQIQGLRPCSSSTDSDLHIDSTLPVVVLTHGCLDSAARFTALAEVFAFQGQQAICFTYDDRDSLFKSASELSESLRQLSEHLQDKHITLIAHSQGGLIARKALTGQHATQQWQKTATEIDLVTISAPFSGVKEASHCASGKWRAMSLGLVDAICWMISGDKWYEITDVSDFIQNPGTLLPQVAHYLKLDTDERGTCRSFGPNKQCLESDYVFGLDEQQLPPGNGHANENYVLVQAGHTEIVGDFQTPPHKLISILQQQGIMKSTQPEKLAAMNMLLSRLY